MEKSDCYYRRRQLMSKLEVPLLSEIKQQFGDELYDAFTSICPDALKPYVGLSCPLTGPGDDLWMSPSDALIGKVCLKPPLTNRHMKALTHQGILSIGQGIEAKLLHELELEKQRALAEQEEMLVFMAKVERERAVEEARNEERRTCRKEKEQMRLEFEKLLREELAALEERLKDEYEELMRTQKEELEAEWQQKLEEAVAETTAKLTEQFLEDLKKQEEELLEKLRIEIKKEEIKRKLAVQAERDKCRDTFEQLKHQLQCKNVANMMYVLCMERRKCETERNHLEKSYRVQLESLQANLTEKQVEIGRLERELAEKTMRVDLREQCILEILRQYQKLINFALRATPTQAEFLVSIERMMMFELAQAVAKSDRKRAPRLAETVLPWKEEDSGSSKSSSAAAVTEAKLSLIAKDYHGCYDQLSTPPKSEHSLGSKDYLPAFHYDKHMYVREDFRNMMSQGIEVSPSNLIWNHEVEHLVKILKRSVTSLQEQRRLEEAGSESLTEQSSIESIRSGKPGMGSSPSVHFDKENRDFLYPSSPSTSTVLSINPSDLYNEISVKSPPSDVSSASDEKRPCYCLPSVEPYSESLHKMTIRSAAVPLIGTRDSLEMRSGKGGGDDDADEDDHSDRFFDTHVEFFTKSEESYLSPPHVESSVDHRDTGILAVRDSLHKHRMSIKPTSRLLSEREDIETAHMFNPAKKYNIKRASSDKISHLSLSRDSVFIHKRSLIGKHDQDAEQQQQQRKSSLTKDKPKKQLQPAAECRKSSVKSGEVPRATPSKLSLSRDSVDLAKSRTQMSKISGITKSLSLRGDGTENRTDTWKQRSISPPIILLDNDPNDSLRTVKMSHIEVLPLEHRDSDGPVNIEIEEQVALHSYDVNGSLDKPWLIYNRKEPLECKSEQDKLSEKRPRDDFLTKPNAAIVLGNKDATEHLQNNEDFALDRAGSMLNILKRHPSLIKMFTSCTN